MGDVALTCMRGYPGAGKSYWARVESHRTGTPVVSRDDLRKGMFNNYRPGKEAEDVVTVAERATVEALLKSGQSVIVDAMHVNPRYLRAWAKLAQRLGVGFEVKDVRTSVEDCIRRDLKVDRL